MMLAYIDPGTGYLVLQMIVAAVVGSLIFVRQQFVRAGRWLLELVRREPRSRASGAPAGPHAGAGDDGADEA
jgi:hypothetical protein